MKNLIDRLDKIAQSLEDKGIFKEAEDLDVISNTLEKLSYKIEMDPVYKKLEKAFEQASVNNVMRAKGFLQYVEENLKNRAKSYKDVKELQDAFISHQDALGALNRDDVAVASAKIQEAMGFLKKAEPEIIKKQMP